MKEPKAASIAAALSVLALVGVADLYTGPEVSLDAFYLIPVALIAWFVGAGAGIAISVAGAVLWLAADTGLRPETVLQHVPYWNAFMRLAIFLTVTGLLVPLKAEADLEKASPRADYLTKAANKRSFLTQAELEIQRSHRYRHPFTLVYLDIDNLRFVNSRMGHTAGDTLLQEVARILKQKTRATDLVGRMGGDEFAMLLPETQSEAAQIVVRRLQRHLLDTVEKNEWPVSFSFGVATFVRPPGTAEEMLKKGDALLSAAKESGRNIVKHEVVGPVEISD
ncbi:MAG: diguanylate cyclase [Candidatus Omnitrophica bacterium]|nr:diguanylate cyclase [Candidatus Omnitrophota bacterium]